jgi:hypothetical protein
MATITDSSGIRLLEAVHWSFCFVTRSLQWVTVPVASAKLVLIESFHALVKFWRIPFEAASIVMQLLEE